MNAKGHQNNEHPHRPAHPHPARHARPQILVRRSPGSGNARSRTPASPGAACRRISAVRPSRFRSRPGRTYHCTRSRMARPFLGQSAWAALRTHAGVRLAAGEQHRRDRRRQGAGQSGRVCDSRGIHEARPDIVAAAHTHSLYGKAWSTLGRKLDPLTQDSCSFYEDHELFDDFQGVVLDTREGARIAEALGSSKAVILKNHGILTAGPTVEAAAWWYIALDNACHTQLLAEAAGTPQPIDEAVARHTHGQIGGPDGARHAFESLYEGLVEAEPELLL